MTHYYWMHWFWITIGICSISHETKVTTVPPVSIEQPDLRNSTTKPMRYAKAIGGFKMHPTLKENATNFSFNASLENATRSLKPSVKKLDFIFTNVTIKLNSSKVNPRKELTVITQNSTDISINTADNQTFMNNSFNAINNTDNVTYFGDEEIFTNLTSEQVRLDNETENSGNLSAAGITGITLGCVVVVGVVCVVSYLLYRNRGFNRPQVLNDRFSNPDSSGYIDDASVRDNSEEMYSLDNDSFLNSLEAMTIQNYWTDTVKHTKL